MSYLVNRLEVTNSNSMSPTLCKCRILWILWRCTLSRTPYTCHELESNVKKLYVNVSSCESSWSHELLFNVTNSMDMSYLVNLVTIHVTNSIYMSRTRIKCHQLYVNVVSCESCDDPCHELHIHVTNSMDMSPTLWTCHQLCRCGENAGARARVWLIILSRTP